LAHFIGNPVTGYAATLQVLCEANGKEFDVQAATIYESSLLLELLIDSESPPFEFALRRQRNVMQVLGLRQA